MTRRKVPAAPQDYREHRARWAGLVVDVRRAMAAEASPSFASLADRSIDAERCWTMVAPYPRGLVCRVMARLTYAWARQTDAGARAALAPLLVAGLDLVDALLAETTAEPAMARAQPQETVAVTGPRLPYRED